MWRRAALAPANLRICLFFFFFAVERGAYAIGFVEPELIGFRIEFSGSRARVFILALARDSRCVSHGWIVYNFDDSSDCGDSTLDYQCTANQVDLTMALPHLGN